MVPLHAFALFSWEAQVLFNVEIHNGVVNG